MRARHLHVFGALLVAASGCFPDIKDYPEGNIATGGSSAGGSSAGGSSTGGAGGEIAPDTRPLGDRCVDTVQCAPDLECFKEDSQPFGGPANGICTRECKLPSDCPSGTHCLDIGGVGFCFELCTVGSQNDQKCQGRRDVGCTRVDFMNKTDVCVPSCSDDSQCNDGRVCDRETSLCKETPHSGAPAGTLCGGDNGGGVTCRGDCDGVCIERCVVGAPIACDQTETDEPLKAECLGRITGDEDVGDGAFCTRECNNNQDCGLPLLFVCDEVYQGNTYCRLRELVEG